MNPKHIYFQNLIRNYYFFMISLWTASGCNDFDTHIWAKIKESKLGPSFIIIQDPTRYIASCWSHYLKNHIQNFIKLSMFRVFWNPYDKLSLRETRETSCCKLNDGYCMVYGMCDCSHIYTHYHIRCESNLVYFGRDCVFYDISIIYLVTSFFSWYSAPHNITLKYWPRKQDFE